MKPWLRSPSGAPVPATAPPTSRRTKAGGVNSMICQRSMAWSGREPARLLEERRRRAVEDPAGDADQLALAFGLHRRFRDRVGAERGRVDVAEMGEVEQVLDQQHVVAPEIEALPTGAPAGIVDPVEVLDQVRVGRRRVAHPDPDPVISLDGREAPHPCPGAGSTSGPEPGCTGRRGRRGGRDRGTRRCRP